MTTSALLGSLAVILYLSATLLVAMRIGYNQANTFHRRRILLATAAAVILHGLALGQAVIQPSHLLFSWGIGLSTIGWASALMLLAANLTKSIETLGLFVWPLAMVGVVAQHLAGSPHPLPIEYGAHILLAILAYSILGLATAQAVLYSIQERHFKRHRISQLLKALPPLTLMEKTLYQLLILGFTTLTFALLTGAFFVEDLFAQSLIHKTFFSITAWIIYALLLWGHFRRGWRGQKAAKATFLAFFLLVLSYLGSQFVLEILLNRL
ncbi:MAG TPA: cytochrome C biogenesis protein [Sulfurivirga caldicuralii]|nr:cytochrome C biogenesis protein [Sulfurivirga caldicuralii]